MKAHECISNRISQRSVLLLFFKCNFDIVAITGQPPLSECSVNRRKNCKHLCILRKDTVQLAAV